MRDFSCDVRTDGALTILEVTGEVDLAVGASLWDAVESVLAPGANVVLDCAAITFFDSTGLRVVLQASDRAKRIGAAFGLASLPEPVSQVLDLAAVGHLLSIYRDTAEARLAA